MAAESTRIIGALKMFLVFCSFVFTFLFVVRKFGDARFAGGP